MNDQAFRRESDEITRTRLRVGWPLGVLAQIGFWALDVVVAPPELHWPFLGLRVGLVALASALVFLFLRTGSAPLRRLALLSAMIAMTAVVPTMTFVFGGFGSLYSFFVPLSLCTIAMAVAWPRPDLLLYVGASLGYYLLGNLLAPASKGWTAPLAGLLFVVTAVGFALLTAVLYGRARRIDFQNRLELQRANLALRERSELLQRSHREVAERESRLAVIGSVTSSIVHDLRNPLTTVHTFAQSALEEARQLGHAEIAGDLETVLASSRRLKRLLEEILGFARGRPQEMALEPVGVAELLQHGLTGLGERLQSRKIDLSVDTGGFAEARVVADRDAIGRVLENLVRNAEEAILEQRPEVSEGRRGQVRVQAVGEKAAVAIRVIDDGCGIAPEVRERLFQPFASGGKAGGTGLGLTIARTLARAHGGELTAEPAPDGGGAAFRLTLPMAGANADTAPEVHSAEA